MLAATALLRRKLPSTGVDAFVEGERRLSARELFESAARIRQALARGGVGPGDRVAIALPRGLAAVTAVYGVILGGATYVPIDPAHPASRLAFIVSDAACRAVIGHGERPAWCGADASWVDAGAAAQEGGNDPICATRDAEEIAAILYTSGSTGTPKGVSVSVRAMDAFVRWAVQELGLGGSDRIASLAPFHFDLSLFDLFASMQCGGAAVFVPQELTLSPSRLTEWLGAQRITTWYTVPSMLAFWAARGGLGPARLPDLRRILFAGEVFPLPALNRLAAALPHVELSNLFGPTETNVCTFWRVDRGRLPSLSALPIGAAACEAELAIAEDGELCVRGPCVMSGYFRHGAIPERIDPGGWYRTGDLVSQNELGELLYHGRKDRMLKCAGFRVEPAEIEAALEAFPSIQRAIALGVPDAASGQRVVAAVVADDEPDPAALMAFLRTRLAPYMIPACVRRMSDLPMLPNGKTDMAALGRILQRDLA